MQRVFTDLIERARSGDAAAQAALLDRHASRVRGLIRRRLCSDLRRRYDTMDVVQSVFLEVIRDFPRVEDRGEPAFRNWLYIKAANKVRQKLRREFGRDRRRWEPRLSDAGTQTSGLGTPDIAATRREEGARAHALVAGLGTTERQIVRLRVDEGREFADIATRLGLPSADAARKRYARALVRMRAAARVSF